MNEGIRKIGDELKFDWETYTKEDIIPLKPVHNQFITRKIRMFVGYAFVGIDEYVRRNPEIPKKVAKSVIDYTRHELKSLKQPEVKENVDKMLDIALNKFESFYKLTYFDLIVSPESSSPLNNFIINKMKKRVSSGGKPMVVPNAFVKNAIKNINVYWDLINKEQSEKTKENVPIYYKSLMNNPEALYAVKKVPASYRRYFIDFLRWSDGVNPMWINYTATKGRILLVDDTVGEGTTANEMVRLLNKYNPNEIILFSPFLDYGANYDKLPSPTY